jgi:hypothetical protein
MKKVLSICIFVLIANFSNAQIFGPYIGGSAYSFKSNLFNSDDLRVDSFQTYKKTLGFAGSFDFGYLWENGVSLNSGLQLGSNNQKYVGGDSSFPFQMEAKTKLTFLRIPLTIGKQRMDGEHKTVFIYSAGLFYSYNTGYKDEYLQDYYDTTIKDFRVITTKKTQTVSWVSKDTIISSYVMNKRPYTRHGFGAVATLGISYKLKAKLFLNVLAKGEFQITNAEVTDRITFSNIKNSVLTPIPPVTRHTFGNYAKYMTKSNANHNRAGTHPFNLGLSIGLRYYLFEFNE